MYTLKVSYGDVDAPEDEEAKYEILGTYKTWDEACEAAQVEYHAILCDLAGEATICVGETEGSCDSYYITYGYYYDGGELDSDYAGYCYGYDHYYRVVIE